MWLLTTWCTLNSTIECNNTPLWELLNCSTLRKDTDPLAFLKSRLSADTRLSDAIPPKCQWWLRGEDLALQLSPLLLAARDLTSLLAVNHGNVQRVSGPIFHLPALMPTSKLLSPLWLHTTHFSKGFISCLIYLKDCIIDCCFLPY